ncbi:hypothetical protein V1506DRAFT_517954 [Lipomyces tetrasporus]
MANLASRPGLGPVAAVFDNVAVLNAVNPHPVTGYAHGPIPDNNPGWKPTAYLAAITNGARKYDIKAVDILADPPPNLAVVLNKENTGVSVMVQCLWQIVGAYCRCDIVVNPPAQMCGVVLPDGPSMRRHIRQEHPGATVMPDRRAKWRSLRPRTPSSPGRGPDNGNIGFWCDALERIAASDRQFANTWGMRFHRYEVPATPGSGHRARRRGPVVPGTPIPFAGFAAPGPVANEGDDEDVGDDEDQDGNTIYDEDGNVLFSEDSSVLSPARSISL